MDYEKKTSQRSWFGSFSSKTLSFHYPADVSTSNCQGMASILPITRWVAVLFSHPRIMNNPVKIIGHIPCRWFRVSVRRWHLECSGFNQNVKPWWSFTWYLLRISRFSHFSVDPLFCFCFYLVSDYFFHKRVVVLRRLKNGNLIWWTDLYR